MNHEPMKDPTVADLIALGSALALHSQVRDGATPYAVIPAGYTAGFLAQRLGYRHRGLQFRAARVTVRNAARVARLHRELTT